MAGCPQVTQVYQSKPGSAGGIIVILRHYERNHRAQKHLQLFNQDGDSRRVSKRTHVKGTTEGQKLTLMLAAIETQMQRECTRGTLA